MTRTIYRRSDIQVCQGHATVLACCTWEDSGCEGHGVVSYCDGSCASALDIYLDMLATHRVERPAVTTDRITLDVHRCEDGQTWRVVFEGPDAQARALAYRAARTATHNFNEAGDAPFSYETFPELATTLYPQCHHGMSAELCMDPYGEHHFGTCEQERAQFGW